MSKPEQLPIRPSIVRQVFRACAVMLALTIALLVFPAYIPWMVSCWLGWFTWSVRRGRPSGFALAACLGVLLVKRIDLMPAAVGFMALLAGMMVVSFIAVRKPLSGIWVKAGTVLLWVAWLIWLANWHSSVHSGQKVQLATDRPIVCIGDSLSSGVSDDGAYAVYLARLVSVPVVDLARAGINSTQGLELLPKVLEVNPQALILELGGHDWLGGGKRETARANLETFIRAARAIGCEVILVEVPRDFIYDPFSALERGLARQYDLELVPDSTIRQFVIWSAPVPLANMFGRQTLSNDGLHPNAAGAQAFAEAVLKALVKVYGSKVIK
jgi:acyl-CoA thioesterase I